MNWEDASCSKSFYEKGTASWVRPHESPFNSELVHNWQWKEGVWRSSWVLRKAQLIHQNGAQALRVRMVVARSHGMGGKVWLSRVQSPSIKSGCAEQQSAIISLLPYMNSSVCTYRTMWDKNKVEFTAKRHITAEAFNSYFFHVDQKCGMSMQRKHVRVDI